MLSSQRALFDIPSDVALPERSGLEPAAARHPGGRAARLSPARASHGSSPPIFPTSSTSARVRRPPPDRRGCGRLALVSSVGYGVAIAGKVLKIPRGARVLVLENDHTSPVLEWISRADAQGFTVETVAQPQNGDWTSAVLEAIERPGALRCRSPRSRPSTGRMADCSTCMRSRALRRQGAALLVDATHGVGVIATDVKALDPDFLIFPTYKWVLGPYGRAFVYVAKRHQDGVPLEQTSFGRRNVKAENPVYFADTRYLPDARRYDMGERDHFISMEMASIGMEMMAPWGAGRRRASGRADAADRGRPRGRERVQVHEECVRAPHILSLGFADGMPRT